jgi:hypothetical protein
MKKNALWLLIGVLLIIVGIESYSLINISSKVDTLNSSIEDLNLIMDKQKEEFDIVARQEHKELAEKIIIHTYLELNKAGSKKKGEPVGLIVSNMKLISSSYTGEDEDIKTMLYKVQDYLDYKMYEIGLMPEYEGNISEKEDFRYYITVTDYVRICISKYALFDKIGLYD